MAKKVAGSPHARLRHAHEHAFVRLAAVECALLCERLDKGGPLRLGLCVGRLARVEQARLLLVDARKVCRTTQTADVSSGGGRQAAVKIVFCSAF